MADRPVLIDELKRELSGIRNDARDLSLPILEQWDHFRAIHNISFIEAYSVGRIAVQFVLRPLHRDREGQQAAHQLCTIYRQHNDTFGIEDLQLRDFNDADGGQENKVLVEVIQLREGPKEHAARSAVAASFVRLQPFNEVDELVGRSIQFTRDAPVEVGLAQVDWKCGVPIWSLADRAERFPGEVVQSRAEIVHRITDDCGHVVWKRPIENRSDSDASLRVFLDHNSVWVVTDESLYETFEVSDVMLCPCDLQFRSECV